MVSVSAAFTCEDQDEAVVRKIIAKAKDLLTREETIEFIAVQKKLVVTISPEAILLTNRRFMVVRPKLMGMTFEDYLWREVQDVHMSEQLITATVSCQLIGGEMVVVDCIPKAQARKIYAFAQEAEEKMHEIRRRRQMQENRAAAGGVVVQTQANIPTPIAENRREDPVQTLGKLKELLDAGLISASEYEAKKAEVLSRM
ncbi:MAG: PH domain-containing protein [Verrucomicrobiota bacterium]